MEQGGDVAQQMSCIVFGGEIERVGSLEIPQEMRPVVPRLAEVARAADAVKGGESVIRGVRVEFVGEYVGDAGGQIVSLVDEQEGTGWVEAGLVEKERAVPRREYVIVVAHPDVVLRERAAGDLVGANAGVAARGAERVDVASVVGVEVKAGQSPGAPAAGVVVEVRESVGVVHEHPWVSLPGDADASPQVRAA